MNARVIAIRLQTERKPFTRKGVIARFKIGLSTWDKVRKLLGDKVECIQGVYQFRDIPESLDKPA